MSILDIKSHTKAMHGMQSHIQWLQNLEKGALWIRLIKSGVISNLIKKTKTKKPHSDEKCRVKELSELNQFIGAIRHNTIRCAFSWTSGHRPDRTFTITTVFLKKNYNWPTYYCHLNDIILYNCRDKKSINHFAQTC